MCQQYLYYLKYLIFSDKSRAGAYVHHCSHDRIYKPVLETQYAHSPVSQMMLMT